MYARSIYLLSHYHCQNAIQNVEILPVLVLYIIRKCCYSKSNPPIHGILSPLPYLYGILNPLFWLGTINRETPSGWYDFNTVVMLYSTVHSVGYFLRSQFGIMQNQFPWRVQISDYLRRCFLDIVNSGLELSYIFLTYISSKVLKLSRCDNPYFPMQ
jgi:hypothetical protein